MASARMNPTELGGPLLASVSRSFYLSIRLLPRGLRAPIGLASLLARASDTIADTAEAPVETRLRHLAEFARMIRTGRITGLAELQSEIRAPDPRENALINKLDQCFAWLKTLESKDHGEIAAVLQKIIHGQTLDLQRFGEGLQVAALQTAEELEEYAYLVAGCVGEFWTRVCLQHLPDCSHLGLADLRRLGANYGKGLQLVNILRDLPSDLRQGRCYLPETELRAAGTSPTPVAHDPTKAQVVFDRWHARAAELLEDGHRYILALRSPKLRAACFLPWYLGIKTLRLMRKRSPLGIKEKLKVPRSTVRFALVLAGPVAFSDRALSWVKAPPPDRSAQTDQSDQSGSEPQ
jgi:farnesyl-diphosphate farnesyltransferase